MNGTSELADRDHCTHSGSRNGASKAARVACCGHNHFVQFYEDDQVLVESVASFITDGFLAGHRAVIVATPAHRESFARLITGKGIDLEGASWRGEYVALDAEETLAGFMVDGVPDAALFNQVVGGVVRQCNRGRYGLHAFGEMVALLWAAGNGEGAIRLEELWNDLAEQETFTLLCAYPMSGFTQAASGEPFLRICEAHSRVFPAESYDRAGSTEDDRRRAITILQQKAASLEAEIAERKEAEELLARRERELTDFLENATEGIHKVGADGKILWANQAELDLLGYEAGEYIGHHISEFYSDTEVIGDILRKLTSGEKLRDREACLRHKDGTLRWVSINSSAYFENGKFGHTKCFTRDITGRKAASEELERLVAERTIELQEKVAELEAFSYTLSHDMRAPLRSMHGYSRILMQECGDKLTSECRGYLERISVAGERMDRLIEDVLHFSSMARAELTLEPVDLDRLVRGIVESYPNLQGPRTQVLVEGRLPSVLGNPAALTQCISNLLGNAVKFIAPNVPPRVRLWAEGAPAVNGDAPMIRLFVQDNGIGIPKEAQERIWQMFQRMSRRYEGTGIGLAIVKKAAERMGGRVGVHSQAGEGSTFWIDLKAVSSPMPSAAHR